MTATKDSSSAEETAIRVDGSKDRVAAESVPQAADESLSFGQMLASTLWAALGVQSKKNKERDFAKGRALHFILFGIGFTICFVLGMFALVRLVLSSG